MFNRQQYLSIGAAVLTLLMMYFGCDRVPKNHKSEKEHTESATNTGSKGVEQLLKVGKEKLNAQQAEAIGAFEKQIAEAKSDTAKSNLLKKLSGAWYRANQKALAGHYANEVATIDNNDMAWNIAGSTFFEGINESDDATLRNFCTENATKAFEKAIALSPSTIEYQIAAALCYTENPPQDNPMKGILMLRELDTKYPENPQILYQLAKLAMRTNQYDKAVQRLEQILKVTPNNPDAICMLSDAYRGKGDTKLADDFAKKCTSFFKKK